MNLRSTRFTLDSIIGGSAAIADLKQQALMAAANTSPVLITGESGTGKELFAQAIHHAGQRKLQPFIQINCAAIPRDLLESELFGYDRGAFTGALSGGKPGKFEIADGGPSFSTRSATCRWKCSPSCCGYWRKNVSSGWAATSSIRSDFRLIAATNQDLEALIARGIFRKDLYYRLNVISLHIPPLRERREDVAPLARHLLANFARNNGCAEVADQCRGHGGPRRPFLAGQCP